MLINLFKYGIVLVGLYFFMRSCNNWIDPARVESELQGDWVTAEYLTGAGDRTTQMYKSPYGKVMVKWEVSNSSGHVGLFTVRAKNPKGSVIRQITDQTVGAGDAQSGQCAFSDAMQFFLEVNATVPWKITVDVTK